MAWLSDSRLIALPRIEECTILCFSQTEDEPEDSNLKGV